MEETDNKQMNKLLEISGFSYANKLGAVNRNIGVWRDRGCTWPVLSEEVTRI